MERAYNKCGYVYLNLKDYQKAIRDFSKSMELNPKDATAYYNRGIAYGGLGNHQQAIEDIKIAARLGFKEAQDLLKNEGIGW